MIEFVKEFYPGGKKDTFFESCGVADLITTCYGESNAFHTDIFVRLLRVERNIQSRFYFEWIGGRNRKVSEAFVTSGKTIEQLETEMLNGQKLQGPPTAKEVNFMLAAKKLESK